MVESGETDSAGGTDAGGDTDGDRHLTDRAKAGIAIAAFGVLVPGITDNLLTQAGAPGLGALVWAIGFGTTVVALWYVVLRPLDIGAETEA